MKKLIIIAIFIITCTGAGADPIYNASNGHYYEMVVRNNDYNNWEEARTIAQGRSHLGLQGDLVTITSTEEYNFIIAQGTALLPNWGTVWVGANVDALGNGYWINDEGAINDQVTPWVSAPTANTDIAINGNSYDANAYKILSRTSNCGEMLVEYQAIPEPATFGLFGLFGGAILFIRRSFRI